MENGTLKLSLETEFLFLEANPKIEIRNSQLRLVSTSYSGNSLNLEPGLYEISAVMQDGYKYKKMVHLEAGITSNVEIKSNPNNTRLAMSRVLESSINSGFDVELDPSKVYPRRGFYEELEISRDVTYLEQSLRNNQIRGSQVLNRDGLIVIPETLERGFISTLNDFKQEELKNSSVSLLRISDHVKLRSQNDGYWEFEPIQGLEKVPKAVLRIDGLEYFVSLPVNPCGDYPQNACKLYLEDNGINIKAYAWIDPSRTVGSSMQHMWVSGYLLNAIDLADEATQLLLDKYKDPTGAILGGLLLNKAGRLDMRKGWIENLAYDFDWLPDGKVLLSLLLFKKKGNEDLCIELLDKACNQRMMFTESYSLLLKQLRTWPFQKHTEQCRELLMRLSQITPYIDWSSITFCHWDTD